MHKSLQFSHLKGMTLIEMTATVVVTSLFLLLGFYVFQYFQGQDIQLQKKTDKVWKVQLLDYRLHQDISGCKKISQEGNTIRLYFPQNEHPIYYYFEPTYTIRWDKQLDTFPIQLHIQTQTASSLELVHDSLQLHLSYHIPPMNGL